MRRVTEAKRSIESRLGGLRRVLIDPLLITALTALVVIGARAEEAAPPVKAQITGFNDQGYGRVVLTFSEETKAEVKQGNGILVVSFGRPVEVAVAALRQRIPDYVQAARADPDNLAIRLGLARKVGVNVMRAGEKLFIDLLPADWAGPPPGLPQEVVDELANRARDAERRERMKEAMPRKVWAPVRLRYASTMNITRFAFEFTEPIATTTQREGQEIRIIFAAPVKVEFGETKARLPASVVGLDAEYDNDETVVKLVVAPEAGVRSFHEDAAFIVDVTPPPPEAKPAATEGSIETGEPEKIATAGPKAEPKTGPKTESKTESKAEPAAIESKAVAPMTEAAAPQLRSDAPAATPASDSAPAKSAAAPSIKSDDPVLATLARQPAGMAVSFAFGEPVAGALFRRGDTIFVLFDTRRPIRLDELSGPGAPKVLRGVEQVELPQGRLIKLKLDRNRLASLQADDSEWNINIGEIITAPSRPLPVRRVYATPTRAGLFIPLASPGRVHAFDDPDNSDSLVVVTAPVPARGLVRTQEFVDFGALATIHGLAFVPRADDLMVELAAEGVTVTRPEGLMISEMATALPPLPEAKKRLVRPTTPLDPEVWKAERDAEFFNREMELARAVAETPIARRSEHRLALARFYLAHDLPANALGTIDAGVTDELQSGDDAGLALLHGLAELGLGRYEEALKDLSKPSLAASPEAALLRASALMHLAQFPEAREQFALGRTGLTGLPVELQRVTLLDGLRAAIEVSDFAEASRIRNEFETVGVSPKQEPTLALLSARLAQGVGKTDQAASELAQVALGDDGPASAEARLRLIEMRYGRGDLDRIKAITALESLSFAWRGNITELETLRFLGRLYVQEARYREAFRQLDAALLSRPGSEITRAFQAEMAAVFEDLFLSDKGASLEPIDALAIYYDFSKLTPIGRRGDELIRRLAERLVGVDLLDQAAELLDHQVEFRLSGAAKAQVAAKLAMIHLMNRKPAEAIRVLAGSRSRELPQELREQRLLLEARAMSETGRHDAALDMIANLGSDEAARLRADILWNAKRWREAGEAIERLLGDRWKTEAALDGVARADALRAGIAYALGDETIGLGRLRDRYAAKMDGAERNAFQTVVSGGAGNPKAANAVAKTMSMIDSLDLFIRLYRARFPDKPLPEGSPTAALATR